MPNESDKEEIGGGTAGAMAVVAGVAVLAAWCLSKWLGGNSDPEPNKRQEGFTEPNVVEKWEKPSPGWFKLNTDGMSSCERGDAAAGGLIRDDTGRWIVGFTAFLGCCDSTLAELEALRQGFRLARDQEIIQRVEVETDSEAAYILIEEKPDLKDTHKYGEVVKECRRLKSLYGSKNVRFRNVDRKVNACADAMAKVGRKQSELLKVWAKPPPDENVRLWVKRDDE